MLDSDHDPGDEDRSERHMTNPNYRPGVTVELSPSGNLIIESRYQNAGNARVVVERGDVADLIAELQKLGVLR